MGGDRVLLGRDVCLWEALWGFCRTRGSWWCCPTGLCVVGDGRCHTWGVQQEFCRLQVSQAAVRWGCVRRCLACPPVGVVALSGQGPNPASRPDPCHREPLPHVGGCHGDGRRWGDLWRGGGWITSHTPHHLPGVSPSSTGRAGGGRAGDRAPPVSAWAGCWQRLCAGAGMETCWHPGAAAGDADGCS